jgi:nanoRNase/pAp phosphatase (c-di-AMP/oligoRNAs hydrolase)
MIALKGLFSDFHKKYRNRRLAVVTHREADLDAIAACFAVSSVFPKCDILLFDNPDDEVSLLIEKLSIRVRLIGDVDKKAYEGVIIVDSSSSALVKGIEGMRVLCVIDHHRQAGNDLKGEFQIVDEESPSTAEILANILPHLNEKVAFALSVGVIADTAQFNSGRVETFETLGKLMRKCNANYRELLFFAEPPKSLDKKIAIAKAIQKMQFVEHKGMIIAICKSGSSESAAATMLASKLDVAFVAKKDSKDKKYTRISGRVNKNTEVRLNEVMAKVGEMLNGKGGGHHKAAGARVLAKPEDALKACVDVLVKWLDGNS